MQFYIIQNSHILTSINTYIGLEYTEFRFGLSYDMNTSRIWKHQRSL